jgi:hypothetical protein
MNSTVAFLVSNIAARFTSNSAIAGR